MTHRLGAILIGVVALPALLLGQAPDSGRAKPPVDLWLSAGVGEYRGVKLREQQYDLNDYSGLLGQISLWVARHGVVVGVRRSVSPAIVKTLTVRDERSMMVGVRRQNRSGHALIAAGIARATFSDFYADSFYGPSGHWRDERGLALGGELSRTWTYGGFGVSLIGVNTASQRYAGLTASFQFGSLR